MIKPSSSSGLCEDRAARAWSRSGDTRYDSDNGLSKRLKRFWRPRVYMYGALGSVGCFALSFALVRSAPLEANLLRLRDPFVVEGGRVLNAFEVHMVNKRGQTSRFQLRAHPFADEKYTVSMPEVELAPLADVRVPIFVDFDAKTQLSSRTARIDVFLGSRLLSTLQAPLLAPR